METVYEPITAPVNEKRRAGLRRARQCRGLPTWRFDNGAENR
jgi:hypothetical protein